MEVHHHPHVPTHAKPWKEYLLEGLMIFVAVTLGYGAENIREHFIETKKAVVSAKNLYKDVLDDSVSYAQSMKNRNRQDVLFEIISDQYEKKQITQHIPELYAAHSYVSLRMLPIMNSLALDEIKSSGTLRFIEDDSLKTAIQLYAGRSNGLKLREQREFSYIDRMIDPITTTNFKYTFFREIGQGFKVVNKVIVINIAIPEHLNINKAESFDWENYFSILGMLKTIRKSTDNSYILPTQEDANKLLKRLRKYLIEHNALGE
ncbi:MAG: hypothetical protein D4R94_00625 [Chitinophagaceae bacterium]|nr:MAG: hypothetical protein D4R94_00625 [Chitinophagaceae bacterium]